MNESQLNILLVDDDPDFVGDFKTLIPSHIYCASVESVDRADTYLKKNDVDVVFLDIELGAGGDGLTYLQKLKTENPYLPVIMISADRAVGTVVKAMRLGASYYVGKSPKLEELKISIDRAIDENRFRRRYAMMESELNQRAGEMIGESEVMTSLRQEIDRLAQVSSSVLITGQSGTGKELVAREIHRLSPRKSESFIAVNCPALSGHLIETELFGHEKGSFTGAETRHTGKFENVGDGTLFLDEITEIPVEVQSKLLRVLQERKFERVGGHRTIYFRGRVLASSNQDIDRAVADGTFREDLLYRLNVTQIHVPPLSERKSDIPLLINYLIRIKAEEMKKRIPRIEDEAVRMLCSYDWSKNNVRELSNCIENAIVHCDDDLLKTADFTRCISREQFKGTYEEAKKKCLADFQRNYITVILKQCDGNISRAAEAMDVSRQGLIKMIKACGLRIDDQ
jgi:DNA-binding NtrC family response regulator